MLTIQGARWESILRITHLATVCPLRGRTAWEDRPVEVMEIATRKTSSSLLALRGFLDLPGTNWLILKNRFLLLASAESSQCHTFLTLSVDSVWLHTNGGTTVQKERGVCQSSRTMYRVPVSHRGPDFTISQLPCSYFPRTHKFRKGWTPPSAWGHPFEEFCSYPCKQSLELPTKSLRTPQNQNQHSQMAWRLFLTISC